MAGSLMHGHEFLTLLICLLCLHNPFATQVSAATRWTVGAAERTYGHWWVNEVHFYRDEGCSQEVTGYGNAIPDGAGLAFDGATGVLSTFQSSCNGCDPGEAWVGLEFLVRVAIRCVRILQSGAKIIALLGAVGDSVLYTHVFENVHGGIWTTLSIPDSRSVVTLANAQPTVGPWTVHQVEFYTDDECTSRLTTEGTPVPSSAGAVFGDGQSVDSEPYRSACEDCFALDAWVAKVFTEPQDIRCVRAATAGAASLSLLIWDAATGMQRILRTWDVIPDVPNTLSIAKHRTTYVLFNTGEMGDVHDSTQMSFHDDAGCLNDVTAQGMIVPGSARSAFDTCGDCSSVPIWQGRVFDDDVRVSCIWITTGSQVPLALKRLVEPDRAWQDVGSWVLPAGANVSISLAFVPDASHSGAPSVQFGPSAFEPTRESTTAMTVTSTTEISTTSTATTTTTATSTTSTRSMTSTTSSTVTVAERKATTMTTTEGVKAAFQTTRVGSQLQGHSTTTRGVEKNLPSTTLGTTTTTTTTHPLDVPSVYTEMGEDAPGAACAGSASPGAAYWLVLALITSVAVISTCCSLRWQLQLRARYRAHSPRRSKVCHSPDSELKWDAQAELQLKQLRAKYEAAKKDRDIARSESQRFQHEVYAAQQQAQAALSDALRFERHAQDLIIQLDRLRSDAPVYPIRTLTDEIDSKVSLMHECSPEQRRSRLKVMKAQYHPDYQRVKTPELAKVFVQLSQHINRYCDVHLRRDCKECTSTARDIW